MSVIRSIVSASLVVSATSAFAMVDNAALPEPVRAPAGAEMTLWSVGKGEITYICKEKADQAGAYGWVFGAPDAKLYDKDDKVIGKYYGGPTWEANDGSKVTGKQLAVAPNGSGNIPLQLVQTEPATGSGVLEGTTYIQRLNTKGGVAPSATCDKGSAGKEMTVKYEADYVFYGKK